MSEELIYDGLQRCPYLPGQVARMPLYRQLRRLTLEETDARFAMAERRVGNALYSTRCPTCRACEGLRIPVERHRLTKSQRRTRNRAAKAITVEAGRVSFSEEKLDLFLRHKAQRGLSSDDELSVMCERSYTQWLIHSCMMTMEMRYYFEGRLVGVGVLDVGARSMSSVYFYFDPSPEISKLSLGTYSVLCEIDMARKTGRDHLYLGLYVEDCRHLVYKGSFYPHERLVGGTWLGMEKPESST